MKVDFFMFITFCQPSEVAPKIKKCYFCIVYIHTGSPDGQRLGINKNNQKIKYYEN